MCSVIILGTDRNNLVQISGLNENFPMPFENTTMWSNMEVAWIYHGVTQLKSRDTALNIASSGYFVCVQCYVVPYFINVVDYLLVG